MCCNLTCYIKAWYSCPFPSLSPRNDLELLRNLENFENKAISAVAVKSFSKHLWYLSETLVALAFFDPEVSVDCKRKMVNALKKPGHTNPARKITYSGAVSKRNIYEFVTSNKLLTVCNVSLSYNAIVYDKRIQRYGKQTMTTSRPSIK